MGSGKLVGFILGILWVSGVQLQCFLNPSTTTTATDRSYETDILDLRDMTWSIMQFISIVKKDFWAGYAQNLTLTAPTDLSCSILGLGHSLQEFTGKVGPIFHLSSIPVLTNVVMLSRDKFFLPGRSKSVILNRTQFESLTNQLGIELSLKDDGPPQLAIFKSENSLILETFDSTKFNACHMSTLGLNIQHSFDNTLQLVEKLWMKMKIVLHFYGAQDIIQTMTTCFSTETLDLEFLLNAPVSSFDFCIKSLQDVTSNRTTRQTSILSFLLGEGKQISAIETSLQESIAHFNSNFRKMDTFDSQIIESFQNLEKDIQNIASIELSLQDQLGELAKTTRLHNLRLEFALLKVQHEAALHRLLVESQIDVNLVLLERALFGTNICGLEECEKSISHEAVGHTIRVHRELISLKPVRRFLISCEAKTTNLIPRIHNSLAEVTISGSFLVDTQIYSPADLLNSTFVNAQVQTLPATQKLLNIFHHFQNDSVFFVQCLTPATFSLNSKTVQCDMLEKFPLPEDFTIEYEGQTLKSQTLIQQKQRVKLDWMSQFEFSNIDQIPIPANPPLTLLHPVVEGFLFDEAGELRIDNVSYTGTVICLLFVVLCLCCCYKSPKFRNFFIENSKLIFVKLYQLVTTENYRLAKQAKKLDKKLDQSWSELQRMQSVLAKKEELKKSLPAAGKVAPEPKKPSSAPGPRSPSAPPLETAEDKHVVEVHHHPATARYSKAPTSHTSRTSPLDKH